MPTGISRANGLRSGKNKRSGKYKEQEYRTERNKMLRRLKHKALHPNDKTLK